MVAGAGRRYARAMISAASVDDAARVAALYNDTYDDRVATVGGSGYRFQSARPEDRMGYWRAEWEGSGAGLSGASTCSLPCVPPATEGSVFIRLPPPRDRLCAVGRSLGASRGDRRESDRVDGRADEGSTAFARGCGFNLEATHTTSAVDPRTVGPPPSPPPGFALVPLSHFADDPMPVFGADRGSALDEPGPSDFSGMAFEPWRRMIWDHPDCDHELGVAAVADGAVVGNAGTGVVREFCGRGLGLVMKQHSLARAAGVGITRAITQNDETNAPMLAINARLGYEPFSAGHAWLLER